MPDYDIITVGGGLGGASIAKATAERLAGILIENTAAPMDYSVAVFNPFASRIVGGFESKEDSDQQQ